MSRRPCPFLPEALLALLPYLPHPFWNEYFGEEEEGERADLKWEGPD